MAGPTPARSPPAARWKRPSCWNSRRPAARQAREKRQISGRHDAQRRHASCRSANGCASRARQGAALFISIHADALASATRPTCAARRSTRCRKPPRTTRRPGSPSSENKADAIAGVDLSAEPEEVADILIDLAQRETKTFSAHFARAVVGELKNAAKLHKHPLKSAGFKVLKAPDVPSVLIELGYVSNQQDLKLMTSEAWRARTSDVHRAGGRTLSSRPGSRVGPRRGSN